MKELFLCLVLSYLPYSIDTDTQEFKQFFSDLKIIELEPEKIELEICGGMGACDGDYTFAYDDKKNIIHVPNSCDLEEHRCRAALLHEFVHFIQNYSGKYTVDASCYEQLKLELEAYKLQSQYLQKVGINFGFISSQYSEYFLAHCFLQEYKNT